MKWTHLSAACALAAISVAHSATQVEVCNAIPNSKQRLACLNNLMKTKIAPQIAAPVHELSLEVARAVCEDVNENLRTRRDLASENKDLTNAAELVVTWPGVLLPLPAGQRPPYSCYVDRASRKVTQMGAGAVRMSVAEIEQLQRDSALLREFNAGAYTAFTVAAKAALTKSLKDPSSVQYKSLFVAKQSLPALCGEINAKNSYGAYVGFRPFYATGKSSLTSVRDSSADEAFIFDKMYPSMCGQKLADLNE